MNDDKKKKKQALSTLSLLQVREEGQTTTERRAESDKS